MQARLSIHVPDEAVHVHELGPRREFILGRDPQCDVVVHHHSISRRHASLSLDASEHWQLRDLGSKNATRVDGRPLSASHVLSHGAWFALGDVYVRFEHVDDAAQGASRTEQGRRRHSSMIWNTRLRHGTQAQKLIADLLRGIVDIAEAKRGFLLSTDRHGEWRVRACHAIGPEEISGRRFSGSRGAIERAISARRPVYLSDQRDQAWLQQQASVLDAGIRALLAIPLLRDGKVLGVVYADTDDAERVYTDLDAQLLDALVDHAGNVMSALELEASLAEVSALLQVGSDGASAELGPAPHWTGSQPALGRETRA
ncbi:FHA domain-containing protein [Dokdonella immobilis]|uniref:GAF domain-containing protein n=1 Tax=Dokdonella immobilis TaxID=578942 RepID=A0A1I4YU54_9GAMM|nr:FHA domain-containing protein [Dokdonella immobilis]SFN41554.1 GAF domain-containing protein [Dokdonella immobilis]